MNGDAGYERWKIGDEWKSRYCPRTVVTDESRDWLGIFSTYKAGHLLCTGGILDQPALYVSTMTLIESLLAKAKAN